MKRSGRGLAIATTVVAVTMPLAACGGGSSGNTAADGTVTIHVEAWKGGGAEPANVAEINKAFEEANPKIKVDFQYVTSGNYTQKLEPELLGGKAGDVIMVDSSKVPKWGDAGYLADLSKESWVGKISDGAKPFTQNGGKTLAMPMELVGIGLYANTDLLKKAGIPEVPADWPTFLDDLGKLKAAGVDPIALPDKSGWTAQSILQASGSTLVYQKDKQWDADFLAGKTTIPSDWQEPLNQLKALGDQGYVNWKNELGVDDWSQGPQDFMAGKSAFWYQGAWQISSVKKAGFPISFAPWPGGAAGTKPNAMVFTGTMWGVNSQSKNSDAARKYVEFWSQAQNLSKFLQAENGASPFTDGTIPPSPETTAFSAAFADGRYRLMPSNTWLSGPAESASGTALQAFLLGQKSAEQALKDIQAAATAK